MELNPGPFTIKEHVLVTIMATVGAQSAYATDVVAVQKVFYHQQWSFLCKPYHADCRQSCSCLIPLLRR